MLPTNQTTSAVLAHLEADDKRRRYFLDAFAALVIGLRPRPEPRYLWDDAASKSRIYWGQLLKAHDAAIDGGQELVRALSFARALEGYVRQRIAERDGTTPTRNILRSALRDGSWIDAHNDVARSEALCDDQSPAALRTLIETAEREIAQLEQIKRLAQQQLAGGVRIA